MAEYVVKGAEPNETVLHQRTPNGYEEWQWLPVREEIVRCKDCKHSSVSFDETRTMCRYWSMNDYDDSESSHGYTLYPVVEPDGFCAWGERKEVDA